jgi:hypothetical protein
MIETFGRIRPRGALTFLCHPLSMKLGYFIQCCLLELQYILQRGFADGAHCLVWLGGGWVMKDVVVVVR